MAFLKTEDRVYEKRVFNQDSNEQFADARIVGGNPDGMINYNSKAHPWARQIYRNMIDRTWFVNQINITKDKTNYTQLTEAEKRTYDLVLAQLIMNDSIQTNQLADRINCYITSPVVNACLVRQAWEEANHCDSYTTLAEDVAQNVDYIYSLHKSDKELQLKNKSVEDMYLQLYNGNEPRVEDLLLAFAANQILEELVFPGGFAAMLSLGHKMPGTKDHIAEIMKDETLSHVPLFRAIFRTTLDENFGGKVPGSVMNRIRDLVEQMTKAEMRWTEYATQGLMGFSPRSIETFVKSKANSVCRNLRIEPLYGVAEDAASNPLLHLLKKHLSDGETSTKTNFFEGNVVDYSKDSLDVDI